MKISYKLILVGWHLFERDITLTLIEKSHALKYYSFLQKFLSKTKTDKLWLLW